MEKDDEVKGGGNSYDFGARMHDSRVGRWWSVDPLTQFVSSQYSSFANNPILLIDIDGKWVPKVDNYGRIIVVAEKGDNYESLMNFFGGKENAKDYLLPYYFGKLGRKTKITTGTEIYFNSNNVYSKSIKDAFDNPEKFTPEDENPKKGDDGNYNCHTASIMGTQGKDFYVNHNSEYENPEDVISTIKSNFKEISSDNAVFGKTLITHGWSHMEVFFGKSKSGETFVFSKNGFYSAPKIIEIRQNVKENLSYGAVRNIDATYKDDYKKPIGMRGRRIEDNDSKKIANGSGYYNPKTKKDKK